MTEPQHHQSVRKRIHRNLEKYPHPNKLKHFIDKSIYVIGLLGPIFAFSQTYKIYSLQSVTGLSLLMFSFNAFANIWWILYGLLHKERAIITIYIAWLMINASIVIGIILYS